MQDPLVIEQIIGRLFYKTNCVSLLCVKFFKNFNKRISLSTCHVRNIYLLILFCSNIFTSTVNLNSFLKEVNQTMVSCVEYFTLTSDATPEFCSLVIPTMITYISLIIQL